MVMGQGKERMVNFEQELALEREVGKGQKSQDVGGRERPDLNPDVQMQRGWSYYWLFPQRSIC